MRTFILLLVGIMACGLNDQYYQYIIVDFVDYSVVCG